MMETVLLTGATGLLGSEISHQLQADGYRVLAATRHPPSDDSDSTKADTFDWVRADFTEPGGVDHLLAAIDHQSHSIVGLVHAARDVVSLSGIKATDEEVWLGEYRLAVVAPYLLAQGMAGFENMRAVVLLGSIYGLVAQRPSLYDDPATSISPHYGASRAAVIHMARYLAVDLAPAITVNTVSFGGVTGGENSGFSERYGEQCPQGRMLGLDDVAGPIGFLLSDSARGVTGANLVVDGGWTIW